MSNLGNKEIMSSNLKYYMQLFNKDRQKTCRDLKIKYSTFSDWLNGNVYPRIDKIEALANYFDIQKSDLIEERVSEESKKRDALKTALKNAGFMSENNDDLTDEELAKLLDFIKANKKFILSFEKLEK